MLVIIVVVIREDPHTEMNFWATCFHELEETNIPNFETVVSGKLGPARGECTVGSVAHRAEAILHTPCFFPGSPEQDDLQIFTLQVLLRKSLWQIL